MTLLQVSLGSTFHSPHCPSPPNMSLQILCKAAAICEASSIGGLALTTDQVADRAHRTTPRRQGRNSAVKQ